MKAATTSLMLIFLFLLNSRAESNDAFIVFDGVNGFTAGSGVSQPAIDALKETQTENREIRSFSFAPSGDWVLLEGNGVKTSGEDVPGYSHLNAKTKNVAYSPDGPWVVLYRPNGFQGPGSGAWVKVKELADGGHRVQAASFAPRGGYVVTYDEAGVSYRGIPTSLARVLENASSNNITIKCVAFDGWNWICLANDEWWTSDTNLPAARVVDQEFKHGQHPKWVAFVPNSDFGSLNDDFHIETRFKQRVEATLTTTGISPKTVNGTLTVYAPIPPNLPMQKLVSCDIRCRNDPGIAPTTVADIKVPIQRYLRLDIPVTPELLQRSCVVDMTYVMDLYSAKLAPGPPPESIATSLPIEFSAFRRESTQNDFKSPAFRSFLDQNGLRKNPDESSLNFAWRTWQCVHKTMHYVSGHNFSDKASTVCQRLTGDCGDHAIVSVSALRANGLASATFPGRWASEEGGADFGQFHVFNGFFQPGIGWITFDALNQFGSVPGNFIAFSLTDEDCPKPGMACKLDQFQMWSYQGPSPFHPKCEDHWHVKVVSKP